MKTKFKTILLLALAILFVSSCKKDEKDKNLKFEDVVGTYQFTNNETGEIETFELDIIKHGNTKELLFTYKSADFRIEFAASEDGSSYNDEKKDVFRMAYSDVDRVSMVCHESSFEDDGIKYYDSYLQLAVERNNTAYLYMTYYYKEWRGGGFQIQEHNIQSAATKIK